MTPFQIFLIMCLILIIGYILYTLLNKECNCSGITLDKAKNSDPRLGLILRKDLPKSYTNTYDQRTLRASPLRIDLQLPQSYDVSHKFFEMYGEDRSSHPLDQEQCGSCWAFATAGAMSDRVRLILKNHLIPYTDKNTGQAIINQLSPYALAGCDFCDNKGKFADILVSTDNCNDKCNGGILQNAMLYLANNGLISLICRNRPKDYSCYGKNDFEKSQIDKNKCGIFAFKNPRKINIHDQADLNDSGKLAENEKSIMQEIYMNGPVVIGIEVYPSFYDFWNRDRDAVYTGPSAGEKDPGGHAVVITGWGVAKDGTKYWRVRNSWGPSWGNKGYFQIQRGNNVISCESDVWACEVDVENSKNLN